MRQSQAHPVHEMMGGNVEATQRGAIAARAKRKHEMKVALTKTQKTFLRLLEKGYALEVEKRGPGYVSHLGGAEIAGREIRFDAAQRLINESLVEKVAEDDCTVKYGISPTAIQILNSLAEARR